MRSLFCKMNTRDWFVNTFLVKKVEFLFVPMLTGEYVSRIEKRAVEKIRVEFGKHGT